MSSSTRAGYPRIGIIHDYLTQKGGAERVVLSLAKTFDGSRIFTSIYSPESTFDEFRNFPVEEIPIRGRRILKGYHRLGLLTYGSAFRRAIIKDLDVLICSSSGFAHLAELNVPKLVYCYNPPRWLYQEDDYIGGAHPLEYLTLRLFGKRLRSQDKHGAESADRYLAISRIVAERIRNCYGIEAEVIHPPYGIDPHGSASRPKRVLPPRYLLTVCRERAYKHIPLIAAAAVQAGVHVVGVGASQPIRNNDHFHPVGRVSDEELRWLYGNCDAVVALAHEDFGLSPIEGNIFGKPTLALRKGGYIDTVKEGVTGMFIDELSVSNAANLMCRFDPEVFDPSVIVEHASQFSPERFSKKVRNVVFSMYDQGLAVERRWESRDNR